MRPRYRPRPHRLNAIGDLLAIEPLVPADGPMLDRRAGVLPWQSAGSPSHLHRHRDARDDLRRPKAAQAHCGTEAQRARRSRKPGAALEAAAPRRIIGILKETGRGGAHGNLLRAIVQLSHAHGHWSAAPAVEDLNVSDHDARDSPREAPR
jgi:hypothetical protein